MSAKYKILKTSIISRRGFFLCFKNSIRNQNDIDDDDYNNKTDVRLTLMDREVKTYLIFLNIFRRYYTVLRQSNKETRIVVSLANHSTPLCHYKRSGRHKGIGSNIFITHPIAE